MRMIALLALLTITANAEDFKKWVARQPNRHDWVDLKIAATSNPVTGYEYTTNVVTVTRPTAAIEQQLAAMIADHGIAISPPYKRGDALIIDATLAAQFDAASGNQGKINQILKNTARMMMRWNALGELVYDQHYGQASYEQTNVTSRAVYGQSPAEANGWTIRDMADLERLMRQ